MGRSSSLLNVTWYICALSKADASATFKWKSSSTRNALNHFKCQRSYSKYFGSLNTSRYAFGIRNCPHRYPKAQLLTYCRTIATEVENKNLLNLSPDDFAEFLKNNKINRCFLLWSETEGNVIASHPQLQEIADWMGDPSNTYYGRHEAVFLSTGIRTGTLLGAFLWRIDRGQACGGIRMSPYSTVQTYLCEGLRLSKRLGIKSALAGLWVGGGKGIIAKPKDRMHMQPDYRTKLFCDYGDFLSSLNGCYIAGMDVGVNTDDLYNVHSRTRWAICGPEDIGGAGNAATLVGNGVICAIEAALSFLGIHGLEGLRVAVQGAGGIGLAVVSGLLERGVSSIYVTDTSQKRIGDLHDMFYPQAHGILTMDKVPLGDFSILSHDCDIVSPCAVGHVLTPETIPGLKAKIVCGAANSLLSNENHAKLLDDRNITYVLEYLPNRMALVNSVYEHSGRMYKDPLIERHFDMEWDHSIYVLTKKVLQTAAEQDITVVEAAMQLAEAFSKQDHPMWPGRTKMIVQDLVMHNWHHGNDFWRKRRNFAKAEGSS